MKIQKNIYIADLDASRRDLVRSQLNKVHKYKYLLQATSYNHHKYNVQQVQAQVPTSTSTTTYKLQATSYKLQATSINKLQATRCTRTKNGRPQEPYSSSSSSSYFHFLALPLLVLVLAKLLLFVSYATTK